MKIGFALLVDMHVRMVFKTKFLFLKYHSNNFCLPFVFAHYFEQYASVSMQDIIDILRSLLGHSPEPGVVIIFTSGGTEYFVASAGHLLFAYFTSHRWANVLIIC